MSNDPGCRIGRVTLKSGVGYAPRARMDASFREAYGFPLTSGFAYDSDSLISQELGPWSPWARSPDAELHPYRDLRSARMRDIERNDGWARGAISRTVDDTIGSLFRLVARPDWRALARYTSTMDASWAGEFAEIVEAEWRSWADDPGHWADAERCCSMVQMFRLQLRTKLIDGESIASVIWRPETVGAGAARFATAIAMIDPDRLCNPFQLPDTHTLRNGVELDDDGAPVAYHIRRAHLWDVFDQDKAVEWDRVPRWTETGRPVVLHDFDRDRIAQHRGLGVLAPVLAGFRMLAKYDTAELAQALLQTAVSTFVESPYDPESLRMAMEAEAGQDGALNAYQTMRAQFHAGRGIDIGGVRVPTLVPGEKMSFAPPQHPSGNFQAFELANLRKIAAAIGTNAEAISQDYSQANYSSLRAAMLSSWRTMIRRRADFALNTATPVYVAWLEELLDRNPGLLPREAPDFLDMRAAYARCRWIGPGRGWIDPVKERQGAVLGLDAGFGTLEQECAEISGADWRDQLEQRGQEVAEFKRLGLKLPVWAGEVLAQQADRKPEAA